ncbi:nucleoside-diphosphate sugar epimerase [Mycobacterium kansasii]|uniref:NAD(P)H-binding protein n=1 Tax=Mycobacterium kansasii TaxID=1768 RepID=UPI000CDDBA82|nr:NAD(P)H-binding protein [Mycobacterium kansasii]POX91786.1 nucleoside-diphosphate sugar epimerase [Mycobacterium kansasii]POX99973.1 nucleoside-diphosphate sugar epimerase [Mycobacterium kansasii]POY06020.1 nucleoside-diphosphate sugar epimerase [Mycobacterium kansasii]POY16372.1 nucleoside-diphosphate sugar epimerase [Mycobacterium kansasii]POY28748.1 nucleoside-diphosphate sugar epimerase [Mycobacterium kansasii]
MTTILVTGATGNVGRPLVTALADAGVTVRAVSRHPDSAGLPAGVAVLTSAADGLRGADAVFLNSRALGDHLVAVVDRARDEGVTRLVVLSAINADDDFSVQPSRFRGDRNQEVEQLAVDSGLEWVSLRPTMFVSNLVGMWSTQLQAGDVVRGPYAAASCAPIVEEDISAVAAQALLTDRLVGRRIALTGPQSFTNAELVAEIGSVVHRRLRYQEVPPEQVRNGFVALGFSPGFADAYIGFLSATVDGPAAVTREVENILGRPAQSFAAWVADHRELFTRSQGG